MSPFFSLNIVEIVAPILAFLNSLAPRANSAEYSLGSVSKGLNVVVTSDITVNKFSPNREENIVMNYINNYISKDSKTFKKIFSTTN